SHEVSPIADRLGLDVIVSDEDLDVGQAPVVRVEGEWDVPDEHISRPYEAMAPEDPAFVLQTSGTTGVPKGVVLTYWNLVRNYDPSYRWIGVTSDDVILQALPLYNTYGLNQGINMMAMTGATMRLFPKFSMDEIVECTESYESMLFPMVPTMVSRFREAGHVIRGGKLKIGIGAAPVARAVAEDAGAVFPDANIYLGYGLTEATAIVALNHIGYKANSREANLESVGKLVTGVSVRINNISDADEVGEILVAGDSVFSSYVGTEAQRPVADGWLNTGDMGRLQDGWLYIVDRKRDLIIRGGQNIYPGEVERALYEHPSVLEAAVIGKPHKDLGEVPVAFITLQPDAAVNTAELQDFCRERLA
ncbi:MAG: class I adenylate-forming enzyme family protein, partial [Gammaproteobacteria bacterium]